jgi:hypothetical protein
MTDDPDQMTISRPLVHHSFDALGAGEMDLQVILGSIGHIVREDCGSEV